MAWLPLKSFIPVMLGAVVLLSDLRGQPAVEGARLFAARCAGCHGSDGAGGEHGPSIVETRRSRTRADRNIHDLIRNGIPDAGMPAFPLPEPELQALAGFVISLRAPAALNPAAGNVAAGEHYFRGEGGCLKCHMLSGAGGILGPDLTNLANERTVAQIEKALRSPGALKASGYHPVTVRLRAGGTLTGMAKNESDYDLQLQTADGVLRLFDKAKIATITHDLKSPMPAVNPGFIESLMAFLSRLTNDHRTPPSTGSAESGFDSILHPQAGNWPTYNGELGGNRHSPLAQINAANIHQLAPRWMFPIPSSRKLEVTPVVVDGVMYVTSANEAYALDARTGRQIWHYARPLTKGLIGDASGGINRGVAILGQRLFMVTDHAHLIALDRISGQLLWDTEMADYRQHYGATSAPLVVNDLVLSGTSGGDEGARGFIGAYRAATGERVWQFWTMPVRPGDPQSETWVGRALEHGCSTAWLTGTYDAGTGLIYWPTGNPCPDYNGDERKGDNLYSSSVVALEPETGKLRWHYQFTPHDLHDWDAAQTPVLVDAPFHGQTRKLLLQANRNGFFYVLDRVTGEFLLGKPFIQKMTWASGIGKDGRPQVLPDTEPTPQGNKVCPAVEGATNWMSTAYSRQTKLFYVMTLEKCNIYTKSSAWWEAGKSFYGGGTRRVPGEIPRKVLRAIDVESGKIVWEYPQIGEGESWGGVLSTDGGLVFFGDDSGALAAADAGTGQPLWHFHTNQLWKSSPMAYAVDGRQFIGVSAGSNIIAFGLPDPGRP
jgi:alcohol dehydrogenase (cytochrome c)